MNYQIISDGSCDLPQEIVEKKGIRVVPFYVSFDEIDYKKEIEEIAVREFYQKMVDNKGVYPKSSMPSVDDYATVFREYAKQEIPMICICITTKFSGSMNSAINAKELILEEYPNAQITIIDSTVNTVLQGLLVLEVVRMQEAGLCYEDTIRQIERIKATGRILFTISSIDYLKKGGRIGRLMGLVSNTLRIQPLIKLKEGEIFPMGIVRSRHKAMEKVIAAAKEHFETTKENPESYSIAVGFGYDYEEAVEFRKKLLESMRQYSKVEEMPIYQIGATIGVHTGPNPLGLGLVKRYDCE